MQGNMMIFESDSSTHAESDDSAKVDLSFVAAEYSGEKVSLAGREHRRPVSKDLDPTESWNVRWWNGQRDV